MKKSVSGILVFFVLLLALKFIGGVELPPNKLQVKEESNKKVAFLSAGQVSQHQEGLLLNSASEDRLYEESRSSSNGKILIGLSASFFYKVTVFLDKHSKKSLLPFAARLPIYLKLHSLRL